MNEKLVNDISSRIPEGMKINEEVLEKMNTMVENLQWIQKAPANRELHIYAAKSAISETDGIISIDAPSLDVWTPEINAKLVEVFNLAGVYEIYSTKEDQIRIDFTVPDLYVPILSKKEGKEA